MELISNTTRKILKNKRKIEKALNLKLDIKGNKIKAEGEQLNEFISSQIFEAIDAGFPVKIALLLSDYEYLLEKIYIKNFTKRENLALVRARLIGKHGQTRELLEELSNCYIQIHDNIVYIIGKAEDIKNAMNSATKIIQGSKQSSVYAYLEKQRKISREDDLGLKIK